MYFVSVIIVLYILFIGLLLYFWNKKPVGQKFKERRPVFLSVIIPARDEAELPLLILDLEHQSLSRNSYEIIVIDDHSRERIHSGGADKIIHQPEHQKGKKAALAAGIEASGGNVIITVDADCRVGEHFLKTIFWEFENYDIVLSPGLIRYAPLENLFEKIQSMETAAVMGVGVGLHHLGMTSLSNGANLAFLKDTWTGLGGYKKHEHIASGDDEFFVQEIVHRFPDKIRYRLDPGSVVSTSPNKNLSSLFYQRLRWAGKWRMHESLRLKSVALTVFLFHLMICAGLILLFAEGPLIMMLLFLIKLILEFIFILRVSKALDQKFYPLPVLILQFIYSPYVVFFGVVANFLPFNWKGRTYSH